MKDDHYMTLPGCNKTTTRHGADMPGSAPVNHLELLTRPLSPPLKLCGTLGTANQRWLTAISGATAMPQFDPELITVMKKVLEDTMMRVPSEYSNPAAKAYFAEYILKAAAQGKTSYDALIVAAADQIEVFVSLFS